MWATMADLIIVFNLGTVALNLQVVLECDEIHIISCDGIWNCM
jgi:hypothetical protein